MGAVTYYNRLRSVNLCSSTTVSLSGDRRHIPYVCTSRGDSFETINDGICFPTRPTGKSNINMLSLVVLVLCKSQAINMSARNTKTRRSPHGSTCTHERHFSPIIKVFIKGLLKSQSANLYNILNIFLVPLIIYLSNV